VRRASAASTAYQADAARAVTTGSSCQSTVNPSAIPARPLCR
jgi:hypothetical protein